MAEESEVIRRCIDHAVDNFNRIEKQIETYMAAGGAGPQDLRDLQAAIAGSRNRITFDLHEIGHVAQPVPEVGPPDAPKRWWFFSRPGGLKA